MAPAPPSPAHIPNSYVTLTLECSFGSSYFILLCFTPALLLTPFPPYVPSSTIIAFRGIPRHFKCLHLARCVASSGSCIQDRRVRTRNRHRQPRNIAHKHTRRTERLSDSRPRTSRYDHFRQALRGLDTRRVTRFAYFLAMLPAIHPERSST